MEITDTCVLIVDDDDQIRQLISQSVQREGYAALAASDAGQALEILDRSHVDLVLLDLHMPGPADGEDLLFLLRDRGDEVHIIIVSGFVDDETTTNQPDCVHAVIRKPVEMAHLVETVKQVLALS